MFKRRNSKGIARTVVEFFMPRGGWRRASSYVLHRLRRLPDTPHRICVGIAAGAFVSFLPIFGLHFLSAALIAWMFRGNIMAAILGTFFGNPLTFPIMAVSAMELGSWLMGHPGDASFAHVMGAIGQASSELSYNIWAVFNGEQVYWGRLNTFWWRVFLPYSLGGFLIGLPCSVAVYLISLPLVRAYQKRRTEKMRARFESARALDRSRQTGEQP